MARVWMVRANGGDLTDEFVSDGHASIGWNMGDLTSAKGLAEIRESYGKKHPYRSGTVAGGHAGQIHAFLHEIAPGDSVLTPTQDSSWLRHGVITADPPYFVDAGREEYRHRNRRRVQWATGLIFRRNCADQDQKAMRDRRTVFLVNESADSFFDWVEAQEEQPEAAAPLLEYAVPMLQRIHGQRPEFLEDLVADLLSAIGYPSQSVGGTGDGGVDVLGEWSSDVFGEMSLYVQVKRYRPANDIRKVSPTEVRLFRSSIQLPGRGLFVTTSDFRKGVPQVAVAPGFPPIALMNGGQLVDLLIDHWDDLGEEYRNVIGPLPDSQAPR